MDTGVNNNSGVCVRKVCEQQHHQEATKRNQHTGKTLEHTEVKQKQPSQSKTEKVKSAIHNYYQTHNVPRSYIIVYIVLYI
jgi:uncharacterized FlaG/YvyC family protein